MFLKVITKESQAIYECKRVIVRDQNTARVTFDLETGDDKDFVSLHIPRTKGYCAFVRADNGKTIDRYNLSPRGRE